MMNNKLLILILLSAFVLGLSSTNAQNKVHRDVIGSGGKLMTAPNGKVLLNGTITESFTGRTQKSPAKHWQGFWYSADIEPQVITLIWPELSAKIGDTITVNMYREFTNEPRGFKDVTIGTYIMFHRKVLKPIGSGFDTEFIGDTCKLKLSGDLKISDTSVTSIDFLVKLGTTDRSFLLFGMPTTHSSNRKIDMLYREGYLFVEDICNDRYVDYDNFDRISGVWPNPAKDEVNVRVTISSETRAQIAVVDLEGRLIQVLFDGVLKAGNYTLDSFLKDLASGNYSVILKTEISVDSKQITIVK